MDEIWKPVVGYESYFKISNFGNVYSFRTNKILKQASNQQGYKSITTRINGKCFGFRINRLVAIAFLDNPENKPEVNHIDGDKKNNHVNNLEWVTSKENSQHAITNGLMIYKNGADNKLSKLSEKDLEFIRNNAKQLGGTYSQRRLGNMFGVDHMAICRSLQLMKRKNIL